MPDIFISYSTEDRVEAARMAALLEERGYSVWWDRELVAGEQYHDTIRRVLRDCKIAIVIWTVSSIQAHWVLGEAETAAAANKLIPIRADALPVAQIPLAFQVFHTIPISDREGLINAVAARLVPATVKRADPLTATVNATQTDTAKRVFISYRRQDAKYQALMIYNVFCKAIPRDNVFMDIDSIPPGADFVEFLEGWVAKCEILVALIASGWTDAIDPKTSRKRLENDTDFVRIEIREALKRGIPVVPVLIDGAPMPEPESLPDDLKKLVRRQGEFVEFRTLVPDVKRLIKKLGILKRRPGSTQPGRR